MLAHLDAVRSGDPIAMARDYAVDAMLKRPGTRYRGRDEIAAYFLTVGQRLAGGKVKFVNVDTERMQVAWRIVGGPADGSCGTDHYTIREGHIVQQSVELGQRDF